MYLARQVTLAVQEAGYRAQLRIRTAKRPVSIICNNCFGGSIYQDLGRQYTSPFVGLFLYPECFVKLVENFEKIVFSDLTFTEHSRYPIANWRRENHLKHPIALLSNDVEIHFVHYKTVEQARSTWTRRRERLALDNLRFVLVQRDFCTPDLVRRYLENKKRDAVAFVSFLTPAITGAVPLKECLGKPYVTDLGKYPQVYRTHFDMAAWLNSGHLSYSLLYRMFVCAFNPKRHNYANSREVFVE